MTNHKPTHWERMEGKMKALVMRFFKNEEGLETVEWGVMLFLIIVGLVAVVTALGGTLRGLFNQVIVLLGGTAV